MTTISPRAIEAAAKAYRDVTFNALTLDECRDAATAAITAYLAAREAEGFVEVPKETLYEIANRASNMGDVDAADWLPSIYRIACEAVGEDPWPTLQRSGFDRAMVAAAQNGGDLPAPPMEK